MRLLPVYQKAKKVYDGDMKSLASLLIAIGLVILAWFFLPQLHDKQPHSQQVASNATSSPSTKISSPPTTKTKISALIIPHHDLVKPQRIALLASAAKQIDQPETIILISPNHNNLGGATIQTTSKTWELADGTFEPNTTVIQSLINQGVGDEQSSFTNEHGIKLVLSDIKRSFPQARLVPVIVKSQTNSEQISKLQANLNTSCNQCLVIASVDFSHYQPALLAQLHDQLSLRLLDQLNDKELLASAEVDAPAALAFTALWAKSHQTLRFSLKDHTNSGVLANDPDIETTTHIFGWYESGETSNPDPGVTFLIGGDMMFGRMIAHTFLKDGIWRSLDQLGDRVFWGTDARIINLEGPVSDKPVPDNTQPNNLVFNFPPQTIDALEYLKVNVASQANNHSTNAGSNGLKTTRELLTRAGIQPLGGPFDTDIVRTVSIDGQNLSLKIIGVHTLSSIPDLTPLIKQLKADPKNRILVFPHWGAEYQYHHTQSQATQAHAWIDAGADLVIGAHPHVIEDSELYNNRPIFYSLGNLLFDQTFSPETQQGLLIGGEFKTDGLHLFALPIQSNKLKPALMRGAAKKSILDPLYRPFEKQRLTSPAGDLLFFPS